jgi:hypothetical protein
MMYDCGEKMRECLTVVRIVVQIIIRIAIRIVVRIVVQICGVDINGDYEAERM